MNKQEKLDEPSSDVRTTDQSPFEVNFIIYEQNAVDGEIICDLIKRDESDVGNIDF